MLYCCWNAIRSTSRILLRKHYLHATLLCIYIYIYIHYDICVCNTHSYVCSCKCIPLKIYAFIDRDHKYFFKGMYVICTIIRARVCPTYIYVYVYHTFTRTRVHTHTHTHARTRTYIYKSSKYVHLYTHHTHTNVRYTCYSFLFVCRRRKIETLYIDAVAGVMLVARIFFISRHRNTIQLILNSSIDIIHWNRDWSSATRLNRSSKSRRVYFVKNKWF